LDLDFKDKLIPKNVVSSELLGTFLEEGYAVIQLVDGEQFIKVTGKYFEELGQIIIKNSKELCIQYWNSLVEETKNCDIMQFMGEFCFIHTTIKAITDGEVDFCETIGEEIGNV